MVYWKLSLLNQKRGSIARGAFIELVVRIIKYIKEYLLILNLMFFIFIKTKFSQTAHNITTKKKHTNNNHNNNINKYRRKERFYNGGRLHYYFYRKEEKKK